MSDDDIHAFGASTSAAATPTAATPTPAPAASAPRSRWWLWLLGAMALLTLLAALAGAAALAVLAESSRDGIQLIIDGQSWPLTGLDGSAGIVGTTVAPPVVL